MGKIKDLTGQKFGKLTVVEFAELRNRAAFWKCHCECGNEKVISANALRTGNTQSCGCTRALNLVGKRFGQLVVLEKAESNKYNQTQYLCRCDCGRETVKLGSLLVSGKTTSCGRKNLIGMRFGKWSVLEEAEPIISNGKKGRAYLCKCDCGTTKILQAKSLTGGQSLSCGCRAREVSTQKATKYFCVPNRSYNRLYGIWIGIKKRCEKSYSGNYHNYGARGITVCEEWLDFENFYRWAMSNGYKEEVLPNGKNKWTIDRIDVNGNYEPNNCRWVDMDTQANNKRDNHYLEFNGKTQSIALWSKETGIPAYLITQRINKQGWSVERALTMPRAYIKKKG